MARGCRCGRSVGGSAECAVQEDTGAELRAEEMTMCRHVSSVGRGLGCSNVEWQLCRITQLLEEQNGMMAQLLQEVRDRR